MKEIKMLKKCFKCGVPKERSEFYAHPRMADGLIGKCKKCNKQDNNQNRAKKLEYYREYDRERYSNDPIRHEYNDKKSAESRKKHPSHSRAHCAVARAVKNGRLLRPNKCSVCDAEGKLHAHHDSYLKEDYLKVTWLCTPCHSSIHKT